MVRQGTSTGRPRAGASLVWRLPVAVTAVAAIVAALLVSASARTPVLIVSAVAVAMVAVACAVVARRDRLVADLRERVAAQDALLAHRAAETSRLAGELLPQVVDALRKGGFPEDVLAAVDAPAEHHAVLRSVADAVSAEEDLRESAQRAFVNIARRVQAIVHQQAQELREMEDRHGGTPEVFGDLLRIDHGTALIGRLADSIAVLGGARPGRQWSKAVPLYSVLRGAMSRIIDYQRVELHSVCEVAVVGTAVEPLIHALSELLDNATRYSPPQTKVHVTATEVQTGIAIEIEDSGVSLSEEARARVEGMLERAKQGTDLQDIGESPRLGLAVVGRLCTAFNMQVSLRSSAYGGVRAILVVPREMMTNDPAPGLAHGIGAGAAPKADPDALEGPKRAPKKRRPTSPKITAAMASMEDDVPVVTEWTAGGLPQRRSRVKTPLSKRIAEQAAIEQAEREGRPTIWSTSKPEPEPESAQDDSVPGAWVEAFWNGLKDKPDPLTLKPRTQPAQPAQPARPEADDEGDIK